jgi:hypothetical protein
MKTNGIFLLFGGLVRVLVMEGEVASGYLSGSIQTVKFVALPLYSLQSLRKI